MFYIMFLFYSTNKCSNTYTIKYVKYFNSKHNHIDVNGK